MSVRKWTCVGSVAAVIAAMMLTGIGPAQARPGDKPPPTAPGGPTVSAPDQQPGASRTVAAPPGSEATLAAIRARIATQVAKKGNKYAFASYLDGTTGEIVLETDAPAAVISTLVAPPSANATERAAAARTVVRTTTLEDDARLNDTKPFYGGGGITGGGAGCSSGYTVYSSVAGYYMVTAGHCYAVGTPVYTETGNVYYGNASNRNLDSITHDGKDLELIGNQTYAGRIFVGNTTSSTTKAVVSAGAASVGVSSYCFSGRTSGESCGHTVTSLTAQYCTTANGCRSPLISYTGGQVSQPGDSGAPFYINSGSGVSIRGHVISHSGSTGYVEPWTVLVGTYNVSIVTG